MKDMRIRMWIKEMSVNGRYQNKNVDKRDECKNI